MEEKCDQRVVSGTRYNPVLFYLLFLGERGGFSVPLKRKSTLAFFFPKTDHFYESISAFAAGLVGISFCR